MSFPEKINIIKDNILDETKHVEFNFGFFDTNNTFFDIITEEKFNKTKHKLRSLPHTTSEQTVIQDDNIQLILKDEKVFMNKRIDVVNVPIILPGYRYGFNAMVYTPDKQKKSRRKFVIENSQHIKRDIYIYKMWSFVLSTITPYDSPEMYKFDLVFNPDKITESALPSDHYITSAFMKLMDFNEENTGEPIN